MPSKSGVSECPECNAGVKSMLGGDSDLRFSQLTHDDVATGTYFVCPMCQIAWDRRDRAPVDVPTSSLGPDGMYTELTAGHSISKPRTSHFRLLGYGENDQLLFRDVGPLSFPNDESTQFTGFEGLEEQLGPVFPVQGAGYPNSIQRTLNALRPGYCVHATVGESKANNRLEFDAFEAIAVAEAVPVEYAVETDFVPEFADTIWNTDFVWPDGDGIPSARRTYHTDGPAADVYVFPKDYKIQQDIPLLAAMQGGVTHHLELFTTNFTGVFTGGVVDVIFIAPASRPYFAVYCLGGDCLDLAHELREALELQTVHQGRTTDRSRIFDIRYNPEYVTRQTDGETDVLVPVDGGGGQIDIETGTVSGDAFSSHIEPHEVVVTAPHTERYVEIARLRAPSARLDQPTLSETTPPTDAGQDSEHELSELARSRLADIVELQPTSNATLAERWGLETGRDAYRYLSSNLDDFYYRDSDSRICATDTAEKFV